jgi:ABC-type bacteriocin/lantibiotic exporter with double-glycine peptidase domain
LVSNIGLSSISSAKITTFFLLLTEMEELFNRIQGHASQLLRDLNQVEKFITLMDTDTALKNGEVKLDKVDGLIKFEGVKFEYPSRPGQ